VTFSGRCDPVLLGADPAVRLAHVGVLDRRAGEQQLVDDA
jgi:hypothetical protein